ncbi:hypothetical protein J2852_005494 [Azospirillum soli]|nr:hypothetical protein [Azospirillum soli]
MPHKANAGPPPSYPATEAARDQPGGVRCGVAAAGQLDRLVHRRGDRDVEGGGAEHAGGQACYSDLAITTALMLRAVFRLALRQTEGLIGSILQLLGLDLPVPDHTTLGRRAWTVILPARRLTGGTIDLLVDSTGLKLCGPGEWLIEKHGTKKRRSWRKLHIGMDVASGRIVAGL